MRFNFLIELLKQPSGCDYYNINLYKNLAFTDDLIKLNKNSFDFCKKISQNPTVTFNLVQNHLQLSWDYNYLSFNPGIKWNDVKENSNRPWNYNYLSLNPSITLEIVQANPDRPWNYDYLSLNPNVTLVMVQENPDIPWNYNYLSLNPNVTLVIVLANSDKPWNYYYLSFNSSITWNDIQTNPHLPWKYNCLPFNPNITQNIIQANLDKPWNYYFPFDLDQTAIWYSVYKNHNKASSLSSGYFNIFDIMREISWTYYGSTYFKYPRWIRDEIKTFLLVANNIKILLPESVKYEIISWVADYLP